VEEGEATAVEVSVMAVAVAIDAARDL